MFWFFRKDGFPSHIFLIETLFLKRGFIRRIKERVKYMKKWRKKISLLGADSSIPIYLAKVAKT